MINRTLALVFFASTAITPSLAVAQSNVAFSAAFETGRIQSPTSSQDGLWIHTLPDPQSGSESVKSPNSDFDAPSRVDTRVVPSEAVGGETVMPRRGEFFLRTAIYHDKDYMDVNGWTRNKPRSIIQKGNSAARFDHDVEGYVGFSVYTPKNYEHELGVRDQRGAASLFVINSTPEKTHLTLGQYVTSGNDQAHWYLEYNISSKSTDETDALSTVVDLGPVSADIGKWTDFVIRYRFNPFTTATNPASSGVPNSLNKTFQGNKGILQVWKSEGSVDQSKNRKMALKLDRVNAPVGLVPDATDKLHHRWQVYKYGWHANPTTVKGPVWYGFDEIRQGLTVRDSTQFEDVSPSGLPCSEICANSVVVPEPPSALVVQ